ncbi:hypothetical protein NEMIN01_1440 [Nematocida minor]|uniref:uncharacterized protein n=1 Tax=Nematocida minor TaxID=1912983 RepID=UPI00221FDB57|nr:uncharacterized protein NEMIN01_1440 [Nematocida minor]KAI5191232.1 hypothetical protein NEMIN01_1440 [Nematocida minor]
MEGRLLYDGCAAIEERVRIALHSTDSAVEEYLARVAGYREISLLGTRKKELPQHPHAICLKENKMYIGTWEGDVFVYEDYVYRERFRVAESRVVKIEEYREGVLIVHANGTISYVENKKGAVHKVEGYMNGVMHPYNPWLISQTETSMHVFDFSHGKGIFSGFSKDLSVFAVHPAGSCLLAAQKTARLIDLRTMESSVEMENVLEMKCGLFHSSSVEMVVSAKKRIKNIDIRTLTHINQIKTKTSATVLQEYKHSVFYSGPELYVRSVCPVTGKSLFVLEKTAKYMAANSTDLAIVGAERVVDIIGLGSKETG